MSEPKRKVALITGGGRGIGRATALKLAEQGYDVAITYRTSSAGAAEVMQLLTAAGSKARMYQADTAKLDEVLAAFEQFRQDYGRIDLLVNNAGSTVSGHFLEMSTDSFDYCMNTDLRSPYFLAQRAARLMVENGNGGVIINITSNQAEAVFPWASVYGTIKAGLNKLTKHMALELAPHKIRVVAVAPGYCDVWGATKAYPLGTNPRQDAMWDCIPAGRYGKPEEVAALVAFLASEDAGYITGTVVLTDGGAALPVATNLLEIPVEERNRKIELYRRLNHEN